MGGRTGKAKLRTNDTEEPLRGPRYIDPLGGKGDKALPGFPPFQFTGVTSRVFPLKANMSRLTNFCDQYLNLNIPKEICWFRPSIPYVYLMVLNYGSMSPTTVAAQNLGWVSQHEVAFTIPLEWWRRVDGRLKFQDWACVSPYIFVDDEMSLATGREVYGWPKVAATIDGDIPLWNNDPKAGERVFSLSSMIFPELYSGERESRRVLLQIDRAAPLTFSTFPVSLNNMWSPLSVMANASASAWNMAGDMMDTIWAPPLRGFRGARNLRALREIWTNSAANVARFLPDLLPIPNLPGGRIRDRARIQAITFKQFRAVDDPHAACYQAVVASEMGFDRVNRCGLMGDLNLLRGDPSGGYKIRIHDHPEQPFIRELGLEVHEEYEDSERDKVAILQPTFPFWNDVDLHYARGQVICSRSSNRPIQDHHCWVDEQDPPAPGSYSRTGSSAGTSSQQPPENERQCPGFEINTRRGAATQPVSGPFSFPDVTLQVYPLLADRNRLETYLDNAFNKPLEGSRFRFEVGGSYVYMFVSVTNDQLGSMWSDTNNIGWWADREVSFGLPVKVFEGGDLVSVAFVTPLVFANSGRAVITDREVNGRPTVNASIEQPPDNWLTREGPIADRWLMRLSTDMFPALGQRQRSQRRTLIEIDQGPILEYNQDLEWEKVGRLWGSWMVRELRRKSRAAKKHATDIKKIKALSVRHLTQGVPFDWLVLKQYRDAEDIEKPCYQALVRSKRTITHIYDAREIETPVHIRIHRSPLFPIVDRLGLAVKSIDSINGAVIERLQPWRPFWVRLSVDQQLGEVLAGPIGGDSFRSDTGLWSLTTNDESDETPDPYPYKMLVGESIGEALGRRLEDDAGTWIRQTLEQELAWALAKLGELSEKTQEQKLKKMNDEQAKLARDAVGAEPSLAFVKGLNIHELETMVRELAKVQLKPDPPRPGAALTRPRFRSMYRFVKSLPVTGWSPPILKKPYKEPLRVLYDLSLDSKSPWTKLVKDPQYEQTIRELRTTVDGNLNRRLTFKEAKDSVESIDELQLVVENILSDQWGNREPRDRRPPEQSVPYGCVFGTGEFLGSQREDFEKRHGLARDRAFKELWCVK